MMLSRFAVLSAGLLLFACESRPAASQAPAAALGVVGNASSASIGNSPASEGATVYSGDHISTGDGGALLVRIGALSIELQSDSGAHVYAAPYGAVVELDRGTIVYSTPGGSRNVVIVAEDVRVTPALDHPDFGRVSIDNPCNVTVQSQRGMADVHVGHESRIVEEGKAYRVHAENSLTYRKYLSPDADDYHDYHEHAPCAAAYQTVKGRVPVAPGQSRFLYLAAGSVAIISGIAISEALESPSRP